MVNQLYLILLKILIFLPIITFGQSKKSIYLCLQDTNAVKQLITGHIQLFSPNNKYSDFIFNSKDSCLQISFSSKGVHQIIIEAETYQTESFTFKSDTLLTNFRFNIFLKRKIINLQEVIIRPEDRVSQHGDTLIIKTNGITTKPHASASELLNKIPGISVGIDGDVTIMGKSVEQVTVNGQSLFGGNSKATLEAIKGDMIQQLELIEPQDGVQGSKRLNLRTKKDKSNGIYSEIGGNGGTSETYLGTVKVNQISPKKFQNFFISTNNINEKLLTAQNESQMLSLIFNSIDGGYSITESTENRTFKVGDNRFDNSSVIQRGKEGINSSLSGGYNYSQSNDKREIFGFVLGDISHQNLFKKATTIQNFDFRKQNQNENTSSFVNNSQLWSSLQAKFKINSKNTLRLVNNFSLNNRQTNEINHRISTLLENSQELSNFQTTRNLDEKINYISTSQQVLLIHRYEKPAKVFSFYGSHFYGNSQTENTYINEILNNNLLVKGNNQQLIRNNQEQYIDFQVVQSLPVSRKWLFDAKLGFTSETYPISQNGYQFNSLDKSYSIKRQDLSLNNFISNEKQGYLFLNFFYKSPKLSFIPGISIWQGNTSRNLLNSNISFQRNRIYPRLNLSYQISKDSRFSIKYNESQQSPNASQLFPLADSSNLQFIRSGNPSLKSFSKQSLQTNFSTSLKTSHHFSLGVQYQEEKNQFVTNSLITDSGGTLQSVSQLGKAKQVNATLFLMQFSRTKPYNYFFMYFMNWRESNVLLNGQPKLIENFIGNFSANLKWLPNQKQSYQLELKSTIYIQKGQNLANSNLRNEFIVKGENEWGKDFYSDFKINYNFTNSLNGKSIINPIIDVSINKYISKNKKIKLFATAKNLLNTQNIFIVAQNLNVESERFTNTLPRFFMVGASIYLEKWK